MTTCDCTTEYQSIQLITKLFFGLQVFEPLGPGNLYFKNTDYAKVCKIASKCDDYNTLTEIEALKRGLEVDWFSKHPQFKHIWHRERSKNHKLMGMWMFLLRTVPMEKTKTCWFAVNGVPVRYSMKEHALISGLDCRPYPPAVDNLGSLKFVKRHFKKTKDVTVSEVREKLKKMGGDRERLKMAVLLFLGTIIKGSKVYGFIDPFLLRIVDDLDACSKFPWGRYTFDDCIENIFHMMDHFKGSARPTWCFPGFIIPLELLACESIPELGKKFREDVPTADPGCPRMCKRRWRTQRTGGYLKGFPLEEINEALGTTETDAQRIVSILEPDLFEVDLLSHIFEDNPDDEDDCYISLNWNHCLVDRKQKIFWKEIFDLDKAGRELTLRREEKRPAAVESGNEPEDVLHKFEESLKKMMNDGFEKMDQKFDRLEGRFDVLERRIGEMEKSIKDNAEGDEAQGGEAERGGDEEEDPKSPQIQKRKRKPAQSRYQKSPWA